MLDQTDKKRNPYSVIAFITIFKQLRKNRGNRRAFVQEKVDWKPCVNM